MVRARPLYGLGYGFESRHSNFDFVAQLVEHRTFNAGVMGSNPIGITFCPSVGIGRQNGLRNRGCNSLRVRVSPWVLKINVSRLCG